MKAFVGEECVGGGGEDVDDGVADRDHVEGGLGQEVLLWDEGRR